MNEQLRKIAVIGSSRIPFCRSNTIYADKTNMDMLSSVIQGVVDRYGLDGAQLDEVVAGAVTTHAKDWNLAREALLSTSLSPLTPGITLQQACGTSLQSALMIGAKIASGQIECGIAAGTDTTSDPPITFGRKVFAKAGQSRRRTYSETTIQGIQGIQTVGTQTRAARQRRTAHGNVDGPAL